MEEIAPPTIAAPSLHTAKGLTDLPEVNNYHVHGANFSLCSFAGSKRGDSFTISKDSNQKFITQNIFSRIMDDEKFTISNTNESRAQKFVAEFV